MSEITPIGGTTLFGTLREYAEQSSRTAVSGNTAVLDDSVEISELATLLSRLAELPDARARRIVAVRNAIFEGVYETPDKLDVAVERLLAELEDGV